MKIISFNANGIRSASKKGFYRWLLDQAPDIVCLQETKVQHQQIADQPLFFPENYFCEYFSAKKKGYSGVAIYARQKPLNIQRGFGFNYADEEGRYLQFDYEKFSVISLYLPSGSSGEVRQAVKMAFLNEFARHLIALKQQGRSLIICGDYNIAHRQIDLKNWKGNQKSSGFLPEERAWLDQLFEKMGFVDAFRLLNQQEDEYTWWSMRQRAREKNVGWRIDYQIVSANLAPSVQDVSIFRDEIFSDHAPLIIDYELV